MQQPAAPPPEKPLPRLPLPALANCLVIDLEVDVDRPQINALAAIRPDLNRRVAVSDQRECHSIATAHRLDTLAQGASFILGHNLLRHDLPHLRAIHPNLNLLGLPAADTLELNPLAFPSHPYHHLVKHYRDAELAPQRRSDPLQDAILCYQVLANQLARFQQTDQRLLTAWAHLTTRDGNPAYQQLFSAIRGHQQPTEAEARSAILDFLQHRACLHHARQLINHLDPRDAWPLAYALAWISTDNRRSSIPPWVLHTHPHTLPIVQHLRQRSCQRDDCQWRRKHHDITNQLQHWFGYSSFRAEPATPSGESLQQAITQQTAEGQHLLAILPTGAGKSICYQVPALRNYHLTSQLTVVISPLTALMADQIRGLENHGIANADTINGMLTMPQRAEALNRVRSGQTAILLISPEQLRSPALVNAIAQRSVASWVLDEAHCLAKWGHDFRPDYRYIGRFIREHTGSLAAPPTILCLTATAKPDVKSEIIEYFQEQLDLELTLLDGGSSRPNLEFMVLPTNEASRVDDLQDLIENQRQHHTEAGIIIYCQTRRQTETIAASLRDRGIEATHFHAGLAPDRKSEIQQAFTAGQTNIITATSAFGMGIDRPDVAAVIHAQVPGSLESYLQEAGRAGRDQKPAQCILLYQEDDIEAQFRMNAFNHLSQRDINAILKALRRMNPRRQRDEPVVATPGELLKEDRDQEFDRDERSNDSVKDTRVKTAVAWLEEAELAQRDSNVTNIYASSLRVNSLAQAQERLAQAAYLPANQWRKANQIVRHLLGLGKTDAVNSDTLNNLYGTNQRELSQIFEALKRQNVVSNDLSITAWVHRGTKRPSLTRYQEYNTLERELLNHLQEAAPDQEIGQPLPLHLRTANQAMRDLGHAQSLPHQINRLLGSIANDGVIDGEEAAGASQRPGSINVRSLGQDTLQITLRRPWSQVQQASELRRMAGRRILDLLLDKVKDQPNQANLLAATTWSEMKDALAANLELSSRVKDQERLLHTTLLWLHEQEIIRLHQGFNVLRQAMTIRLDSNHRRSFNQGHYEPLRLHYNQRTLQVHIMNEYGRTGLARMDRAHRLAQDYFTLPESQFQKLWLAHQGKDLLVQTSIESYQRIIRALRNPNQEAIVANDDERQNTLVLAGPGSGKTRTLVHRIAYLVRVKRERPHSIIALAYNRHAAVSIRQGLANLIGDDARHVLTMTLHSLAMRLTGSSFAGQQNSLKDNDFKQVIQQATQLLNQAQNELPEDDEPFDDLRERLLTGFRWILIDEYQDLEQDHYQLISALAGRSLIDADQRINLFAVGDDDQNIYSFRGSSNHYIRQFQQDYQANPSYLVENYRSSNNIIQAANRLIDPAPSRMKQDHPIEINRQRRNHPAGSRWEELDPVARGRVQLLHTPADPIPQAQALLMELQRLRALDSKFWDWSRCAVIAARWEHLDPVRALANLQNIPTHRIRDDLNAVWHLRETQRLLGWVDAHQPSLIKPTDALKWLEQQPANAWNHLLLDTLALWCDETNDAQQTPQQLREWLGEWAHDNRQRQQGLLLTTAHSAKGLEFDHVVIMAGHWSPTGAGNHPSARRLYYVAMTRARETLTLLDDGQPNPLLADLKRDAHILQRDIPHLPDPPPESAYRYHRLSLRNVRLNFAGAHPAKDPIHATIAALQPDDPLQIDKGRWPWKIQTPNGQTVGILANNDDTRQLTQGRKPVASHVLAIAHWTRNKTGLEYQKGLGSDRWEVVIPEMVTLPEQA